MGQYQSFPDTRGSSRTLEKLQALCLPSLRGKRFLDVGCNEGFFCGYAAWDGAARSVGIDRNADSIARARQRFPNCEFHQQSWDHLPEGSFDVILLASALHYAKDQPALVNALMGSVAPDGVLVLELGVHPSEKNEWVWVKRGIDERPFATMQKLREMLRHYAWKHVGPSVHQAGDPVPRAVVHVRHRRRIAYLLMEPSGYGKSTIARGLFRPALVPIVGGDRLIDWIVQDRVSADPTLVAAVRQKDYHRARIDVVMRRIFDAGLLDAYIDVVLRHAGPGDFALDAYIPSEHHAAVTRRLAEKGYTPVRLTWERADLPDISAADAYERPQAYFTSLGGKPVQPSTKPMPFTGVRVLADEIMVRSGVLTVRGWALNAKGIAPAVLVLDVGGRRHVFERYDRYPRPDVQKHYSLTHASCGYLLSVPWQDAAGTEPIEDQVTLYAGDSLDQLSGPFRKEPAAGA